MSIASLATCGIRKAMQTEPLLTFIVLRDFGWILKWERRQIEHNCRGWNFMTLVLTMCFHCISRSHTHIAWHSRYKMKTHCQVIVFPKFISKVISLQMRWFFLAFEVFMLEGRYFFQLVPIKLARGFGKGCLLSCFGFENVFSDFLKFLVRICRVLT